MHLLRIVRNIGYLLAFVSCSMIYGCLAADRSIDSSTHDIQPLEPSGSASKATNEAAPDASASVPRLASPVRRSIEGETVAKPDTDRSSAPQKRKRAIRIVQDELSPDEQAKLAPKPQAPATVRTDVPSVVPSMTTESTLYDVLSSGKYVILGDMSLWEVDYGQRYDVEYGWSRGERVILSAKGPFTIALMFPARGLAVEAKRMGTIERASGSSAIQFSILDKIGDHIILTDMSAWSSLLDTFMMCRVGDRVFVYDARGIGSLASASLLVGDRDDNISAQREGTALILSSIARVDPPEDHRLVYAKVGVHLQSGASFYVTTDNWRGLQEAVGKRCAVIAESRTRIDMIYESYYGSTAKVAIDH